MDGNTRSTRVQRIRFEPKRREVEVTRVERLGPGFVSVTFGGESLADFHSASFDDHVKFILPGSDGEPVMRDYTPRRSDARSRELTIEFALHGTGPAADWAAQAQPGQRATVGGPRGSFVIPLDYDWHLLVGDDSALPAIARRLEELPAAAHAIVIAHVAEPGDRRAFQTRAALQVHWVEAPEQLVAAVRALQLPPGEGYAWCACESRTAAEVRRVLVEEKGHDRHAIRAAAYWKRGAVAHHQNIED